MFSQITPGRSRCRQEHDPALPPITPAAPAQFRLIEHARPIIGGPGDYERRRQAERERRELSRIPEWFSAQDLIAAPWESAKQRFA